MNFNQTTKSNQLRGYAQIYPQYAYHQGPYMQYMDAQFNMDVASLAFQNQRLEQQVRMYQAELDSTKGKLETCLEKLENADKELKTMKEGNAETELASIKEILEKKEQELEIVQEKVRSLKDNEADMKCLLAKYDSALKKIGDMAFRLRDENLKFVNVLVNQDPEPEIEEYDDGLSCISNDTLIRDPTLASTPKGALAKSFFDAIAKVPQTTLDELNSIDLILPE